MNIINMHVAKKSSMVKWDDVNPFAEKKKQRNSTEKELADFKDRFLT